MWTLPHSNTEHPERLATRDLASTVAEHEVLLRTTCALEHFRTRERWRGFGLFFAYFCLYILYTHLLIDWRVAGETFSYFTDAISQYQQASADIYCNETTRRSDVNNALCWWRFEDLNRVPSIVQYILHQSSAYATDLHAICEHCKVALTPRDDSVETLKFPHQYACSDFVGCNGGSFLDRDCPKMDADWAAAPRVDGAPCCENATLVVASLVMLAMEDIEGRTGASLDELLDPARASGLLNEFVLKHISLDQHFFQFIISRDLRMVGINFWAWLVDDEWVQHQVVRTGHRFWSKRFDIYVELLLLRVCYLVFSALSLFHDAVEIWASTLTKHQLCTVLRRPWNYFVLASVLFNWIVDSGTSVWDMSVWTIAVAIVQMLMLCRLFVEGEVLEPFKLLSRTVAIATKQLSVLVIALLVVMLVVAGIYGMLFGQFTYANSGFLGAFLDVFGQFGNGAQSNDASVSFNPTGSRLTYIITMLTLYLTLSQVFITILMDSFEQSREELVKEVPSDLPAGFQAMQTTISQSQAWTNFVAGLTYYLPCYQAFAPQLIRALHAIRLDAIAANPEIVYVPPLATRADVEATMSRHRLHPCAVRLLLRRFGARKITQAELAQEMKGAATDGTDGIGELHVHSIIDLRARAFSRAQAVGDVIPYRDLAKMSRQSLEMLLDSLETLREKQVQEAVAEQTTGAATVRFGEMHCQVAAL